MVAGGGSLVAEEVQLLAALTRYLEGQEAAVIVGQLWLTVLPLAQQVLAALPPGSKLLMATLAALCAALSRSLELSRGHSTRFNCVLSSGLLQAPFHRAYL